MFNWCHKINVSNIENHYHFYTQRTNNKSNIQSISYEKLKPAAISITNCANLIGNSKSCVKKGLKLSKKLNKQQNIKESSRIHSIRYNSTQKFKNIQQNPQLATISISQIDMAKTRFIQSESNSKQALKPSTNPILNSYQLKKQVNIKNQTSTLITKFNLISPVNEKYKQKNNRILTQLYSTQISTNYQIPSPTDISHKKNNKLLEVTPIKISNNSNKDQQLEKTSSRNRGSQSRQQTEIQVSRSSYQSKKYGQQSQIQKYHNSSSIQNNLSLSSNQGYRNSKYNNTSKSISASANLGGSKNQDYYLPLLQKSRGEARQASIILSNILSRGSQNFYSSTHNQIKPNPKTFNFQDKLTILSQQNDMISQSQSQIKVQQSQLYNLDPRGNFTIVPHKSITNNIYRIDLAIENQTKFIVSLKQISFRQMKIISQQLQMYQFMSQRLTNTQSSRHILQLYQFQTTQSSYILIKQPYTKNIIQYISSLPQQSVKIFTIQFKSMLKSLVNQFAKQKIYPHRQFILNDFVICQSVIKLQDLSIFKQMKRQIYTAEQLLKITQIINNNQNNKLENVA